MKRLRELEGGGPLLNRSRDLLRAVEPLPVSTERMLAIRRAIEREPARTPLALPLRVALAACVGLLATVAAAEAGPPLWRALSGDAPAALGTTPAPVPSELESVQRALRARRAEAARAASPNEQIAPPLAAPSVDLHVGKPGHPQAQGGAATPNPPARSADAALVHSAVRALRRDGDAERASQLLDRYAARDPNGPLAEEALALRIEAALARRDPKSRAYAAQYLAKYPSGRYGDVARRALRGGP